MIDWAIEVAKDEGWPQENVHWERFSAPPPGKSINEEKAEDRNIAICASRADGCVTLDL